MVFGRKKRADRKSSTYSDSGDVRITLEESSRGRPAPPEGEPPSPRPPSHGRRRSDSDSDDDDSGDERRPKREISYDSDDRSRKRSSKKKKKKKKKKGDGDSSSNEDEEEDDDHVEMGARVMDSSTVFASRLILSILAVILLWSTSLTAILNLLAVTNAIPIPRVQLVIHETIRLFNESVRLRSDYMSCVQNELDVCNATLHYRMDRERARSEEARAANLQTRDDAQKTQAACGTAHARALASVSAWVKREGAAGQSGLHYNAQCTAEERKSLEAQTGDTNAQKSATYQLATGYSRTSQGTVGLLADQVQARQSYDTWYLYNKTLRDATLNATLGRIGFDLSANISARLGGLSLDTVKACATLAGGSCPDGAGVRAKLEAARTNLETQYSSAMTTYVDTANKLTQHAATASQRLAEAQAAFTTIQTRLDTDFPSYGGFAGIFPSVSLPDTTLNAPPFSTTLPSLNIPASDSFDAIAASAAGTVANLEGQLSSAVAGANLDASALQDQLGSVSVEAFEDYNPPSVDALKVKDDHAKASATFEQDAAVSLDAIEQAQQTGANQTTYSPIFTTNVSASGLVKKARNTNWFSYKFLEDAGFTFEWLLTPFNLVSSLFQVLDMVWRLLQSISIMRRFWGRSALAVSPIDVTTDAESKSRAQMVVVNPLRGIANMLTSPVTLTLVLLTFIFVTGSVCFAIYRPFYGAYQVGCIARGADGNPTGDGTVLTKNAYAIAFNYASHEGNKLRLGGLDEYDIQRGDACARYGEKSANDEQRVQAQMDLIVGSHVRTTADVKLMRRCYNLPYLDASFTANPVNDTSTGQPYPLLSVTLGEPQCDVVLSNSSLEAGVYDCTKLPDCNIECNDLADDYGNDQSELYSYSRAAMCTAQWWLHATVLRMTFSVTIWVFINLWRVLFISGLIRLCWQFLNTGFFTYLATCTAEGKHTYEEEHLADRVRGLLRYTRSIGLLVVVVACGTQVPWIAGLYYFSTGLVFQKLT